MFKNFCLASALIIIGIVASTAQSLAANPDVGSVTRLENDASIIRSGSEIPLEIGAAIKENDEITSGKDARVEITFTDGTNLRIGENARIGIDEYLYDPDNNVGNAIIGALQGPFRFITGKIGELKNKRIEVKSSLATIGIRGTDFWGGPSQGTYGVFLFEGTIVVFNAQGGRIVSVPGTGVDVDGADKAPTAAEAWGSARAEAALATVTFR